MKKKDYLEKVGNKVTQAEPIIPNRNSLRSSIPPSLEEKMRPIFEPMRKDFNSLLDEVWGGDINWRM